MSREGFALSIRGVSYKTAWVQAHGELIEKLMQAPPGKIKAIENMLGIKLGNDENVTISFCCSGGGFRAMTSTLGFLMGAEEIGLINSATYITGLSGSTWMMAPWTAQGNNLKTFKENLIPKTQTNLVDLKNDPWPLDNLSKVVSQVFLPKYIFKQPLRLVDTYGVFLASKLFSDFGNKRERIRLSHSQKRINNGNWIFPIYTAVEVGPPYIWFEFTPYEIGSSQLNSYVPSWSFGRKFNNGQSIDKAPEQSLGYFLAIFGSAFAFSFKEGLNEFTKKIKYPLLRAAIKTSFRHAGQEEQRMSPASIHNFLRGIQGPPKYGNIDFSNITDFTLVDAGIAFNLPFPPLLRAERKTDIIIALDASSTIKNAPALKGAEKFAKNNGLKFPKIDYTNLEKKTISVFKDENDPETPVIIYLPLLKNVNYSTNFNPQKAKFCGTFNFLYTPSQLNKLSGLTKFNILEAKDTIKTAILDTIKRKRKWAKQKEFSMEKSDEVQEEMQEIMN